MDDSLPGSSVHGILQARILEWVAVSFSRGSSQPRDRAQVSPLQVDSLLSELLGNPLFDFPPIQNLVYKLFSTLVE